MLSNKLSIKLWGNYIKSEENRLILTYMLLKFDIDPGP
jgi:hypothetical protein